MNVSAKAVLACVVLATAAACSRGQEGTRAASGPCAAVAERTPAPALALKSLDGREYSLAALKGKTVVVDFWATWCPPCEFQIPVLNAVYDAWRDRGVVVLGVAVDAEGAELVAPYATEHAIRYPVLLGDEALARSFGAVGFPTSVLVAPDGSMSRAHAGLVEKEELDARLACLQPSPPAPEKAAAPAAPPS